MAIAPHIPWTDDQRKLLCKLLRDRGLWEDRHAVCGIHSLSALTIDQATACIKRLTEDRPARRERPTLGAKKAQRALVVAAWRDLGYPRSGLAAWLKKHAQIDDLEAAYVAPLSIRLAIDQLLNMLEKLAAEHGWYFRRTRYGYVLNRAKSSALSPQSSGTANCPLKTDNSQLLTEEPTECPVPF